MIRGDELLRKFLQSCIENPPDEAHLDELIKVFLGVLHFYKCLQGHPTPYHEITQFIYNYKTEIRIDDLNLVMDALELKLEELKNDDFIRCFRKFKRNILLAVTQKYYIQKVANDALGTAKEAEKIASYAKRQAKRAKKLTQKMVANYVSILGIFATIIIAVFGGINLISSTVKLLEDNSRLSYLVFVVSFLMACLLTLIRMLTTWISSVNSIGDEKDDNEK